MIIHTELLNELYTELFQPIKVESNLKLKFEKLQIVLQRNGVDSLYAYTGYKHKEKASEVFDKVYAKNETEITLLCDDIFPSSLQSANYEKYKKYLSNLKRKFFLEGIYTKLEVNSNKKLSPLQSEELINELNLFLSKTEFAHGIEAKAETILSVICEALKIELPANIEKIQEINQCRSNIGIKWLEIVNLSGEATQLIEAFFNMPKQIVSFRSITITELKNRIGNIETERTLLEKKLYEMRYTSSKLCKVLGVADLDYNALRQLKLARVNDDDLTHLHEFIISEHGNVAEFCRSFISILNELAIPMSDINGLYRHCEVANSILEKEFNNVQLIRERIICLLKKGQSLKLGGAETLEQYEYKYSSFCEIHKAVDDEYKKIVNTLNDINWDYTKEFVAELSVKYKSTVKFYASAKDTFSDIIDLLDSIKSGYLE